ncbi:MAG: glycoside hydrolase family 28 protein [Lachnospiraceae bacterium]|nr:glycoside hydrolase family 28 protein [Lachnospiraceae bacterium]
MNLKILLITARSITIEIEDGGRYYTRRPYILYLNGQKFEETDKVITNLFSLTPDTEYELTLEGEAQTLCFRTLKEFVTLNVRDFGAAGDGEKDDTAAIQAAILACPRESRVLIPKGTYKVGPLFLKSYLNLELAEGAVLSAKTDKEEFPRLPGLIQSYDETDEYNLASWEGNPLNSYASILTGLQADHVVVYGKGEINGNASRENWWGMAKTMQGCFRPHMLFINHCRDFKLQGLTFKNSPSWTLHPYFSVDVDFLGTRIINPADSPNTDGIDPESVKNMNILGMRFTLGDDCIAVKSGKIYMGRKFKQPSEQLTIRHCYMENGHGAVTVGSEMAGGVKDLLVENCIFSHTDRGLRIKTRRGRGKDAILDGITFRSITMDHVMTPLVVNSFYFCDPDGHTSYVQSRDPYPVDERTPQIRNLTFEDMECTNCHVRAAYFEGLPEQKIEKIEMRNISISFAEDAKSGVPAMSEGVEACSKQGLYASNIKELILENVRITGQDGAEKELYHVDNM